MSPNHKIVILGGGQAGYFTALWCRKIFPSHTITLIEGQTKGTVGVGEATTPHIINFLKFIDIDIFHFIKNTGAALKNGISFENWNGDHKKYMHSFLPSGYFGNFSIPNIYDNNCYTFYLQSLIRNKLRFNSHVFATKASYQNKISVEQISSALHFDNFRTTNYLRDLSQQRNITIVKGDYKKAILNEKGFIQSLLLDEDRTIDCDFVFDCSGFGRLLIDKLFKSKWKSYKEHLPMKAAIPFFLKSEAETKPYTSAIAMKHGWIWNIPLRDRIGAGYVYDSDYINEDEAVNELKSIYPNPLLVRNKINFEAGRFETPWINNCIGVGLSSNFIEPLESTSIWMTIYQLYTLSHFLDDLFNSNADSTKFYNTIITNNFDAMMMLIYLHYCTKRQDSDFWKNFKKNYIMPENLKNIFNYLIHLKMNSFDLLRKPMTTTFGLDSYLQVAEGLELFQDIQPLSFYDNLKPSMEEVINELDPNMALLSPHDKFLNK